MSEQTPKKSKNAAMTILSKIMRSMEPKPKEAEFKVGQEIPEREIKHWNKTVKAPHAQFELPCVVVETQNRRNSWWSSRFRDATGKVGNINRSSIYTRQMILRRVR